MSFWSRLTDIADDTWDGVYGAATGAAGLIWDLAGEAVELTASEPLKALGTGYRPDEESVIDVLERRLPQLANHLLGPEGITGTYVAALPEAVRAPAREVIEPTLRGLETAYREGIGEPISTALTAGSLVESGTYRDQTGVGRLTGIFRGQTWKDAYRVAQHRSPGQALALTFTDDILNEREVQKAQGSDWYRLISGTFDATLRMSNLSPDVFIGHTMTGIRLEAVTKPISPTGLVTAGGKTVERRSLPLLGRQRPLMPQVFEVPIIDPDSAAVSRRVQRIVSDVEGRSAAEIADRHFRDHPFRAEASTLLADAADDVQRTEVMKGLLGSGPALDRLGRESPALANRMERLKGKAEALAVLGDSGFVVPGMNLKDELARLTAELDELYPEQLRLERAEAAYGTLQQVPRYRATAVARSAVTRSDFFQTSRYAAPLRVVYNLGEKLPHQLVNLEDPTSDIQPERLLRKANVPIEQADALRGEYMRATTADARQEVFIRVEEAAVSAIAGKYNIDAEAIGKVLDNARDGRGRAITALKSRVYDGKGRSKVLLRGEGPPVDLPLFVSQQANVLPVVDIDAVEKTARQVAGRARRFVDAGMTVPEELLTSFYKLWKPAVLLRVAWPIRVGIDEHLRLMSKIGFLSDIGNTSRELRTATHNLVRRNSEEAKRLPGRGPVVLDGYEFEGPFGRPGEGANIFQHAIGARASFEALAGRYERGFLQRMRRESTGEWESILPDHPTYGAAWENAVNRQIGSDVVGRQLLTGRTDEEIVTWLRGTAEGQKYARRLPTRARNPELWLPAARDQVESYLPTRELREKALAGTAKADDLVAQVSDAALRPTVHGEILAQVFGSSKVHAAYEKIISTMYGALGQLPTDVLARQPYADAVYRAEVTRLFRLYDKRGLEITDKVMRGIEGKARRAMVKETRELLYDLAEQTELAHVMRFVAPFMGAWQEVLGVWAGIAVENPAYVARVLKAYSAPDRAGLVQTDEQGNRSVAFKLPEMARKLPGLENFGQVRLNVDSLNMVLNGPPGVGPAVQLPVAYLLRDRPDLAENDVISNFIFPYGIPKSTAQALLPPTFKRLVSASREDDDEVFFTAKLRIAQTIMIDASLGKRPMPESMDALFAEAGGEAKKFFLLRAAVSFISPIGVTFDSPYQPYIDAYRKFRAADPSTADEKFLGQYGPEFFPLTQALTRSVEGVPATVEGFQARGRLGELIAGLEDPAMARLVVGAEGAGEFSRAVYENQLDEGQRVRLTEEEFIQGPGTRLGWIEYRKAMDTINAEMLARKLPNMQVRAARDLRATKKAVIQQLAQRYPDWYSAYSITDRQHWSKRLRDLRLIAADPQMQARPDIRGLNEYLAVRKTIAEELRSRKAHTLTASSNVDVRKVWDAAVDQIAAANPAFASLRDRWLSSDPVWLSNDIGQEAA